MKTNTYNPDVLNCLANLSNDEVFTPPSLANQVLDMLPQELFSSPSTTFLDPVSKSGVFLREIVKRLDRGLEAQMPDRRQRIDHILRKQVFGIAITELTAHLSRRSVYCSKNANSDYSVTRFDTEGGNILYRPLRHTWVGGKCRYCGASQEVYDRGNQAEQYAYQFIHTDKPHTLFNNMKFDVIIGNPPYQLSDGGNAASARPIYHLFVEQALKLQPRYLAMIIPARWYAGGKGLDEFRQRMLNSSKFRYLKDYNNSADCFPGVNIAGGVCYFLWDKMYNGLCEISNLSLDKELSSEKRSLNEFPTFVRDNTSVKVIRKILSHHEKTMDNIVRSRNSFSIPSNERGHAKYSPSDCVLLSSGGKSYISKKQIVDKEGSISKYKTIITYAMSGGNKPTSNGDYQILSSILVLNPNEVCSETYLIIDVYNNEKEAYNMVSYLKTKTLRFLLLQSLTSIHITKTCFQFVPLQDFSHPWTDEMLYKKYGLTEEEIAFIESMIRPME